MESENEAHEPSVKYPNIISFESTKKIVNQMEKKICKIKIGNNQGTGFFCKIPFPDKEHYLTALITSNHIINEKTLKEEDKIILVKIKEEIEKNVINLNNRMKYTNEEYDITIIEIKKEDNIDYFLEIDEIIMNDLINNKNKNEDFKDKTLYVMQYPKGKLSVSYGIFENIYENKKYLFRYQCTTYEGSSGSPILNADSNKVVGIHINSTTDKIYNKGLFLNYVIKEFIKYFDELKKKDKKIEKEEKKFLKQLNQKCKTKLEKNFTSIDLSNKQIENEGFIILCKIEFKVLNYLYLYKNIYTIQLLNL